jgi:hypothetical protein
VTLETKPIYCLLFPSILVLGRRAKRKLNEREKTILHCNSNKNSMVLAQKPGMKTSGTE